MWQTLIAVLGTLAGAVVAGLIQQRAARTEREAERQDALRRDQLQAVTTLAVSLADHRRAMWVREEARLRGESADVVATARQTSHETRSAITAPHTAVRMLLPQLAHLADDAVQATYRLRHAQTLPTLSDRRQVALDSADHLVNAAAQVLTHI